MFHDHGRRQTSQRRTTRDYFSKSLRYLGQAGTIAPAPRCAADNSTNRNRPCFSWDVFYCTTVFTGVSPCDPGQHLRMPAALCSDKRNEHYYETAKSWPNPFERTGLSAGPSRCSCLLIGPALLRPPNLSVNRRNTRAVALPCAQRMSRRLRRRVGYPIGAWVSWSKCKRDGNPPPFPENANE